MVSKTKSFSKNFQGLNSNSFGLRFFLDNFRENPFAKTFFHLSLEKSKRIESCDVTKPEWISTVNGVKFENN